MNVHDGGSATEKIRDRFNVNFWFGADRPVCINFLQRYLRIRPVLDLLRITDVVVRLEGLGPEAP